MWCAILRFRAQPRISGQWQKRGRIDALRRDPNVSNDRLKPKTRQEQRRDRHEPWFKHNPGVIDLCNVPLPVRTPGGH
jgi:hypothetical protein